MEYKNHLKIVQRDANEHHISSASGYDFFYFKSVGNSKNSLNKILSKNSVHFLFPVNKDIKIITSCKYKVNLSMKSNGTTIIINNGDKKDFQFISPKNNELFVFSINYDYFESSITPIYKNVLSRLNHTKIDSFVALQNFNDNIRIQRAIAKIKLHSDSISSNVHFIAPLLCELQYVFLKQYLKWNNQSILNHGDIEKVKLIPDIMACNKNFSVENLAVELDIPKEKMILGCEIVFNSGIYQLIEEVKLKKIVRELLNTDSNIAEVVYSNGFLCRQYFYDLFNEMYNCDPSFYRITHNKTHIA